jgi:hypothetical protein
VQKLVKAVDGENACVRQGGRSAISQSSHHRKWGKEEEIMTKVCRKKESIKLRAKGSEMENRQLKEENKTKGQFLESITGRVAQVVERLPSKCESLSSNPLPQKKKKKKRGENVNKNRKSLARLTKKNRIDTANFSMNKVTSL